MQRRTALAIAGVGAGALMVGLLWPSSSNRTSPSSEPEATFTPSPPVANAPPGRARGEPTARDPMTGASLDGSADPEREARLIQRSERVSNALALLRYPPGSQPLHADMRDVLFPNRRHEQAMPLSVAQGSGNAKDARKPQTGELAFLLTGDVYTVMGNEPLVATLEVFREWEGERQRVEVDILKSNVTVDGHVGASSLVFADEGVQGDAQAGDKIYTLAFRPSDFPELSARRGLAHLNVEFAPRQGDGKPAQASLDFRVAAKVPAVFTGGTTEKLTPDGLEIGVEMDVTEPGQYVVQGLLFDERNDPIGFAVARPTLTKGRTIAPLLYWGLMFRERNAAGPYVFRTLTGYRLPVGDEADRADMKTWDGTFHTRAYAVTDFSEKEHESAAKEAKIKALTDLATHNPAKAAASQ